MFLGYRVTELRAKLGITQSELASRLCVSKASISYYECGKRIPKIEVFLRLCDVLETTASYLLGQEQLVVMENSNNRVFISQQELEFLEIFKNDPIIYNKIFTDHIRKANILIQKLQ
ncbi:MAG: helix-turn-helix domain-containing protein [Bacilli bacterium]